MKNIKKIILKDFNTHYTYKKSWSELKKKAK